MRYDLNGDGLVDHGIPNILILYTNAFFALDPGVSYQGYELVTNLDFTGSEWDTGSGWQPIHAYSATFEGNGHSISDLFINRVGVIRTGFFGGIDSGAEVRNLTLNNVNVRGGSDIGGLVGQNHGISHGSLCHRW